MSKQARNYQITRHGNNDGGARRSPKGPPLWHSVRNVKIWAAFKADGQCVIASALFKPGQSFLDRAAARSLRVARVPFGDARKRAAPGFRRSFDLLAFELSKRREAKHEA